MIQTSHLFDDSVFELPVAARWMDASKAGKRFSVVEHVEGKIRSLGGTVEGADKSAARLLKAYPGARGSYNPVTGLLALYNKVDDLAAGAVRAAPLGMDGLHVMRTRVRDFLHEMFHSGWNSMLSPEDRELVTQLFNRYESALKKGPRVWTGGPRKAKAGGVERQVHAAANPREFFAEMGAVFGSEGLERHLAVRLKKSEWSALRRVLSKVWTRTRKMFKLVLSRSGRPVAGRTTVENIFGFNSRYSREIAKKFPELGMAPWEQPLMEDLLSRIAPGLRKLREGFEFPLKRTDLGKLKPRGRAIRPRAMAAAKRLRRREARVVKKAGEAKAREAQAVAAAKAEAEAPIGGPAMTGEEFMNLRVGVKGVSHQAIKDALDFQHARGRLPTRVEMEMIVSADARRRNIDIFLLRPEAAERPRVESLAPKAPAPAPTPPLRPSPLSPAA